MFQVQESSFKIKSEKRPKSPPIASQKTHLKEAKSPTPSTTSMTTTRSQSLAMSTPQESSAPQEPESPESIPSQESPLSPEWIHAIINLIGHPLTSEIGQRIH